MTRLLGLLLILGSLTLGAALAAQDADQIGKEVDSRTATDKGAEVDPASGLEDSEGAVIDADSIDTEAETAAAFEALAAESRTATSRTNRATEFLATQEDLSIFLMLLEQAGLSESLAQEGAPVTVFAPSDGAFARLDPAEFSALLADSERLRDLLLRHIASGSHTTSALTADLGSTSVAGDPGAKTPIADVDVDPERAGGGDGVIGVDADLAAIPSEQSDSSVAGGGEAEELMTAIAPALDPSSFVRLETRAGADLAVGTRPGSVRSELSQMGETTNSSAAAVAGGAAATDPQPDLFVDEAQIVTPNLAIDGLTVHVIDRVLFPAADDEADEVPQDD